MNILLAEDDARLGELVVHMLKKKGGYQVDWVQEGGDAYDYATSSYYDILILDWMMPGGDGTDVCRRLRKDGYSGAILMLTAKDTVEDRVEGLDAGADDYLVKPFELAELLARLRALTRRAYVPIVGDCVSLGSFELDRTNRVIRQGEEESLLSPREFGLLDLLVQNKGQVLPRELILDRVWGYDADVSLKIVDATVKLLRKKLDVFGQHDIIQSIRGVGYKIED